MLNRPFLVVLSVVAVAGVLVDGYAIQKRREADKRFRNEVALGLAEAERISEPGVLPTAKQIPAGENFAGVLQGSGLSAEEANQATSAAQHAFNLRQLPAGNTITVNRSVEGSLRDINYRIDADRMLHIVPETQGFSAEGKEIPSHVEVSAVSGRLEDSLFNAVESAGESPEVACARRRFLATTSISIPIRAGRHLPHGAGKGKIREQRDGRLRENSGGGI